MIWTAVLLAGLANAGNPVAERFDDPVARIKFKRGGVCARVKGMVGNGRHPSYLLSARAGQHLHLHLETKVCVMTNVFTPSGDEQALEMKEKDFDGELAETGDYFIRLSARYAANGCPDEGTSVLDVAVTTPARK
jgi:hypothetical protein